jgi:hypothetical protein
MKSIPPGALLSKISGLLDDGLFGISTLNNFFATPTEEATSTFIRRHDVVYLIAVVGSLT